MVVAITPEVESLLKQVKAIESQRTHSAAGWNECLKAMANLYLDKHDPVRKAQRNFKPTKKSPIREAAAQKTFLRKVNSASPSFLRKQNSRFISASVKHQVHQRDQHQCVVRTPQGTRCEQKQWLELDHVIPVAQGGVSSVGNLRTLCHFHHRVRHSGI